MLLGRLGMRVDDALALLKSRAGFGDAARIQLLLPASSSLAVELVLHESAQLSSTSPAYANAGEAIDANVKVKTKTN